MCESHSIYNNVFKKSTSCRPLFFNLVYSDHSADMLSLYLPSGFITDNLTATRGLSSVGERWTSNG